jgi:small conductance mechanosensitive channel
MYGKRIQIWLRLSVALALAACLAALITGDPSAQKRDAKAKSSSEKLTEAEALMTRLEAGLDSVLALEQRALAASYDEREVLRVTAMRLIRTIVDAEENLVGRLRELEASGVNVEAVTQRFRAFLSSEFNIYERSLDSWTEEIEAQRNRRGTASPDELDEIQNRIDGARAGQDRILQRQALMLTMADSLGMNTASTWRAHETLLTSRAENLVGRLQIAATQRDQLKDKIKAAERTGTQESEIVPDRKRLQNMERRVRGTAESLRKTADLLDRRGVDTANYRRFIIQTTGKISDRVLDPRVLFGLLRDFLAGAWQWLKDNAATVFVRLLILLTFVILFRITFRLIWFILRLTVLSRMSRLLADLIRRMVRPMGTIVGFFAGLWFIGVNPAALLAGVGVLGIIVGLALQDSLSNLAAGMFILITRPFDVDDVVQAGGAIGRVRAMGLANTTIVTFDARRLLIPNRKIWGDVIENRSAEPIRRADTTVRIGYDTDVDHAIEVIKGVLDKDERVLKEPEPLIFAEKFHDSWLEISVRPWTRNEDWWPLLTSLPRLFRIRFAEEGIEIPVPRHDVTRRDPKSAE